MKAEEILCDIRPVQRPPVRFQRAARVLRIMRWPAVLLGGVVYVLLPDRAAGIGSTHGLLMTFVIVVFMLPPAVEHAWRRFADGYNEPASRTEAPQEPI